MSDVFGLDASWVKGIARAAVERGREIAIASLQEAGGVVETVASTSDT